MLAGKRVVLVDDSIVRGTTSLKIVQMVRDAGASEVHMRIASPPTTHSCFYGVDTPERSKLIASRMSVEEMADFIKVDSLGFLSIDGLYRAVGEESRASGASRSSATPASPATTRSASSTSNARRRWRTRNASPRARPRISSNWPASPRPDRDVQ